MQTTELRCYKHLINGEWVDGFRADCTGPGHPRGETWSNQHLLW
jgi:hypothetical protein